VVNILCKASILDWSIQMTLPENDVSIPEICSVA
jgi:hypothetical protein